MPSLDSASPGDRPLAILEPSAAWAAFEDKNCWAYCSRSQVTARARFVAWKPGSLRMRSSRVMVLPSESFKVLCQS